MHVQIDKLDIKSTSVESPVYIQSNDIIFKDNNQTFTNKNS